MTTISAALVMKLREITGAGMMDCKKYLQQTNGDIEEAIKEMRKAGQSKADKKAGRTAAEGGIFIARSENGHRAAMLEVNSETDFVSRDDNFITFANLAVETALAADVNSVEDLASETLKERDATVEQARQELVAKIGENIKLRRLVQMQSDGVVGHYLHGNKIGVLVSLKNGDENLAKDIAMHIAASKPLVVSREQVPAEAIENEREIFTAQARESGKPQEIIDKMIEGRISKFIDEVSLLGQPFVKDPSKKISQLLKENNAEVLSFIRFEVGEGVEKKEDNFVEEVMAQVREQ